MTREGQWDPVAQLRGYGLTGKVLGSIGVGNIGHEVFRLVKPFGMKHIAYEGRCWVVGSGFALNSNDIPANFPGRENLFPDADTWINPGDSVVVAPGGEIVAGPLRGEYGILYAEIDPARVVASRRALDVAGHYARPDIFQLNVNRQPQDPVRFDSAQQSL